MTPTPTAATGAAYSLGKTDAHTGPKYWGASLATQAERDAYDRGYDQVRAEQRLDRCTDWDED